MEKEGDYMIKMIEKMIREDIRSMCIKKQAEEDFTAYTDAWMPRSICKLITLRGDQFRTDNFTLTILTGSSGCRSWYKVSRCICSLHKTPADLDQSLHFRRVAPSMDA